MYSDLMVIFLSHDFQYYFSKFGYIGIYVFFVTVDQIAPIPEEITLIIIGYFASQGIVDPFFAGACSLAAFVTIDVIYFWLTKSGNKLVKKLTKKSSGNPVIMRYKEKLKKNLPKTLFILSFIPRVRLLSPVFVALSGIPFRKFIVYNALSLALFIAVYISFGVIFSKSLSSFLSKFGTYQDIIFIAFIVFMAVLSFIVVKKLKGRGPKAKTHSHR